MRVLYYNDKLNLDTHSPSIFLGGPTSRGIYRTAWRARALDLLEILDYSGIVIVPELKYPERDNIEDIFGTGKCPVSNMKVTTYNILKWETSGLDQSTVNLFWMPFSVGHEADPTSLPGFTTRSEVIREMMRCPHKVVLGMPIRAISGGHIKYHAFEAGIQVHTALEETVEAASLIAENYHKAKKIMAMAKNG